MYMHINVYVDILALFVYMHINVYVGILALFDNLMDV